MHCWLAVVEPGNQQAKAPVSMFIVSGLRLLLPALLPSWRFFDVVSASPRLEYGLLTAPDEPVARWQEFRPRPDVLTPGAIAGRMLWNAAWNESLFLVSLAERLMSATSSADTIAHSQRELLLRVARHLMREGRCGPDDYLQIRLKMVSRAGPSDAISSDIVYLSSPYPTAELIRP